MASKKKVKLSDENFHYLIAIVALASWLLHFAANLDLYDKEKLYSGIIFICIAAPFYAICVFVYYHLYKGNT